MRGRLQGHRRVGVRIRRPFMRPGLARIARFTRRRHPRLDGNGVQQERTMLVPTKDVAWTDIWNRSGYAARRVTSSR